MIHKYVLKLIIDQNRGGIVMKAKVFNSFSQYEDWADKIRECDDDLEKFPVFIGCESMVSMDMFVNCKKFTTAIKHFRSAFKPLFPDVEIWAEEMLGWAENVSSEGRVEHSDKSDSAYCWEIQQISSDSWYLSLRLSGIYVTK